MSTSIYSKIREFLTLIFIHFKVKITNFIEYLRVMIRYYSNWSFCKIDIALLFSYFFNNPFYISKQFLLFKREKEIYTYGETPLTSLDQMARTCELSDRDKVFELGCGRGRACFWLHQFIGCQVVGVDYIPSFIRKAKKIKEYFHLQGISFRQEDLFQTDLTEATVIYLYGTCFSSTEIHALIQRFSQLPVGTKIITVSYALTDYQSQAPFQLLKQFPIAFTWGITDVYLQIKQAA